MNAFNRSLSDLKFDVGAPNEARASVERWNARLYVAFVEGEPAAAGALTFHEGVGHLANAATIPELRRRGAQTALIRRRQDPFRPASEATALERPPD